jgi:hypothetical protein
LVGYQTAVERDKDKDEENEEHNKGILEEDCLRTRTALEEDDIPIQLLFDYQINRVEVLIDASHGSQVVAIEEAYKKDTQIYALCIDENTMDKDQLMEWLLLDSTGKDVGWMGGTSAAEVQNEKVDIYDVNVDTEDISEVDQVESRRIL